MGDGQGAADTQVVVLQMVQPPLGGGQLTGEYVRGERAAGGEAGRDDAQGEREAAGEFDEGWAASRALRPESARSSAALSSSLKG